VSYPYPTAAEPDRRVEEEVTLAELQVRPLDVLALVGESGPAAQASELDRRVADVVLERSAAAAARAADLRITYAPDPAWDCRMAVPYDTTRRKDKEVERFDTMQELP
jgi:hypothetical protein